MRGFNLSEVPKNAKILKECSLKTLKNTPSNSQDIVFGSYFINGLKTNKQIDHKLSKEQELIEISRGIASFFNESLRVMKPKGRIVLIAHLGEQHIVKMAAQQFGLKFYSRKLTQREIENSFSEWINNSGNPKGKEEMLFGHMLSGTADNAARHAKRLNIHPKETYHPILISLRK